MDLSQCDDPEQKFLETCDAMKRKIHMSSDSTSSCDNKHKYTLYFYYSGHGVSPEEAGSWQPSENRFVSWATIKKELKSLRKCDSCQREASCM